MEAAAAASPDRNPASGAGRSGLFALATRGETPSLAVIAGTLALGMFSYGFSVVLHLHALRLLGAARQAAFFASAPFVGAFAAVPILGEHVTPLDGIAAR